MAPKIQVKKTAIDKAKSVLAEVAPKEKEVFELREAIAELRQDIEGLLAKGYSFDEAAELLTSSGIEIKGSSLKQYLTVFRRQDAKKASRMRNGKRSQGTKPTSRGSAISAQATKAKAQAVVEQLEESSGVAKNTRKSADRKSSEFVEVSEDL
jgi:uncharacterized coiled-coil DUF342 family protein